MTSENIINYLNQSADKKTPVNQIISDLDVLFGQLSIKVTNAAADAQTLIYSGPLESVGATSNRLSTADVAETIGLQSLGSDGKTHVITIGQTEAGKMAASDGFKEALERALGYDKVAYSRVMYGATENGLRIEQGMWDKLSYRLSQVAEGSVRVLAPYADTSRVMLQTEVPGLLKFDWGQFLADNPRVPDIEGIPRDVLIAIRTQALAEGGSLAAIKAVGEAIQFASANSSAGIRVARSGVAVVGIDTGNFFETTDNFSGVKTISAEQGGVTSLGDLFHQMSAQEQAAYAETFRTGSKNLQTGIEISGALKTGMTVMRWGGDIALVVSYGVALIDAMAVAESGDSAGARNIMLKWTASTEGALLTGALTMQTVGTSFSWMLAGGPPGQLLWGAITLGSGGLVAATTAFGIDAAFDALIGRSSTSTDDDNVWKTTTYANGVRISDASAYTSMNGFEPGSIKAGNQYIDYSILLEMPDGKGGMITKYLGRSGEVISVNGQVVQSTTSSQQTDPITGKVNTATISTNYITGVITQEIADNSGQIISRTITTPNAETNTIQVQKFTYTDGVLEQTTTTQQLGGGLSETTVDNRDGFPDSDVLTVSNASGSSVSYDLNNVAQSDDAAALVKQAYDAGEIGTAAYCSYTAADVLRDLSSSSAGTFTVWEPSFGPDLDPIGAFYDSQSSVYDNAPSIATHTPSLLNAQGQGISVRQIQALDVNADGRLDSSELAGYSYWRDLNEDGRLGAGELSTTNGLIASRDYVLYSAGSPSQGRTPVKDEASAPSYPEYRNSSAPIAPVVNVPASNYLTLRNTDEIYPTWSGFFIWQSNQVVLTWNKNNYNNLIGTEGNDSFDVNYYASSPSYLSNYIGRIKNFMAGGGNDVMGGSDRSDNLWGGTGNDVLFGYAGDDAIYGEEGSDELIGGDGNDTLAGGVDKDLLFGNTGNDVLSGGDGADELQGNEGDDRLTGDAGDDLLLGQVGDDALWGGDGNDLVFGNTGNDFLSGGDGADELQGSEGDDRLAGDAGDDILFGQLGSDALLGGDGNDVLIGFTGSNEPKKTLVDGETDNDFLDGGAGDDILFGGLGNDDLVGGAGRDELGGGAGNDSLVGGDNDDKIFGDAGDDQLWGGDGNDVIVGFTASNSDQQSLKTGETDNDQLHGGAGNDLLLGGFGQDVLYGGAGKDELQGGDDADLLMGDDGDDHLFGQIGDDTLYGGEGNDVLVGFTGSNEAKQTLSAEESDDDRLFGGAGSDTLIGGVGNDYLDGGAGADILFGGSGDDIYLVNSVNDVIYESQGGGNDTVVASTNYLLNQNIESLRLLEGFSINGTGNALNNVITGNSSDNVLDGVTGADAMIGGDGDDTYYVDNQADDVVEGVGEGVDTVQSSISYTLKENVEKLILLDFGKPEKGLVDGQSVLVYGYPKRNELDYMQGDAVVGYEGTCALTSIANLVTQTGIPTTEGEVVRRAIDNSWAVSDPSLPTWARGGSNYIGQQALLNSYNIRNDLLSGYSEGGVANLLRSGRGVILGVDAGVLWGDAAYKEGKVNHVVTVTGAVYHETDGTLMGFYIADSGRQLVSDMTRFVSLDLLRQAANVVGAYAIYTLEPLKLWNENINGSGNAVDNQMVGNRGDNVLMGLAGNDVLTGQDGDDVLDGGVGSDTMSGGMGDDTYVVDDRGDVVIEAAGEGRDTARTSLSTVLTTNVENLVLTGSENIDGTGNVLDNVLTGNVGNNVLSGGLGSDTYRLEAGWGNDIVRSGVSGVGDAASSSVDRVVFGAGVLASNVAVQRVGNDLRLRDQGGNSVIFESWFLADSLDKVGRVEFADGTVWNRDQLLRLTVESPPSGDVTISGVAKQNETLYAANTLVDADGMGALRYQWQSSADGKTWSNVSGATQAEFKLSELQVGHQVRVVTSYLDGLGVLETVASSSTSIVANVNDAPTGGVSIAGNPQIGEILNANVSALTDLDGVGNLRFQWQASPDGGKTWEDVQGATGISYLVQVALNKNLRVVTQYVDGHGMLESVNSSMTVGVRMASPIEPDAPRFDAPLGSPSVQLTGGNANDVLIGTTGDDVITGLGGDDQLAGGLGNDTLFDYAGNNRLFGQGGDDALYGGDGNDVLVGFNGSNEVKQSLAAGATDDDYLAGGSGDDILLGGPGADHLYGDEGDDRLFGQEGNDDLWGAEGKDSLAGGNGNDNLFGGSDQDVLWGGNGDDYLIGYLPKVQGVDKPGIDFVTATRVAGDQDGADILIGGTGNDFYVGGPGDDTYIDTEGDDGYGYGIDGNNDTILDSSGSDYLYFGTDIRPNQVSAQRVGNQLVLNIENAGSVRFDITADGGYSIENVKFFSDGTVWNADQLTTLLGGALKGKVSVEGSSIQGATLVAINTLTIGNSPVDVIYQWQSSADGMNWSNLEGSTGSTLTLSEIHVDKQVRVVAGYTDTSGVMKSVLSESTAGVLNVNDAPFLSSAIGTQVATEDKTWSYVLPSNTFSDVDAGDKLGYAATLANGEPLPNWLRFDVAMRTFSGTPDNGDVGTIQVRVTATDVAGASATAQFALTVDNVNDVPVTLTDEAAAQEDRTATISGNVLSNDRDADAGTTLAVAAPGTYVGTYGILVLSADGSYSYTLDNGSATVQALAQGSTVTDVFSYGASDGLASTTSSLSIAISGTNDAPVLAATLANQSISEDSTWSYTLPTGIFSDVDQGDSLRYAATLANGDALPTWLSFDPKTCIFSGVPSNGDVGLVQIRVTATDTVRASNAAQFSITVNNINDTPVVAATVPIQQANALQAYSYVLPQGLFLDADAGDSLRYTLTQADGSMLPSWLSFDVVTRTLTGTPPDVSSLVLRLVATDQAGASANLDFELQVQAQGLSVVMGDANNNTLYAPNTGGAVYGQAGYDTLYGGASADKLYGGNDNDWLYGGSGNDLLEGESGYDYLYGDGGNDTLSGGTENDGLYGGADNDTLYGDSGYDTLSGDDGNDTLYGGSDNDTLSGGNGNDILDGGAGIDSMTGGSGDDIYYADSISDTITESASQGFDTVNSSVTWTLGANVENLTLTGSGAINGTGNSLDNLLIGNAGNNSLSGGAGNDTLAGNLGADTLTGGAGNDIYRFGRGDGSDTIVENDATSGNADAAQFLPGISANQLWFRQVGNNLEASVIGTTDALVIKNWYLGSQYHVEQFKTTDGKTLQDAKVQSLVQAMAQFNPPVSGQTTLPANYASSLDSVIAASWQ